MKVCSRVFPILKSGARDSLFFFTEIFVLKQIKIFIIPSQRRFFRTKYHGHIDILSWTS